MSIVKTNSCQLGQSLTANQNFTWYQPSTPDGTVRLGVGNAGVTTLDAVTVNNSGNLGLGVTPSAWGAGFKALEIGFVGSGVSSSAAGQATLSANAYYNSGWRYANNTNASLYQMAVGGAHNWYTAPSGTAGNAISFTQAMTLDASGNLLVGTTSAGGKITVLNGNAHLNWGNGYYASLDRGLTIVAGGYADTSSKARIVHVGGVGDNGYRCGWTAYSIKTNGSGIGADYYIRPVTWTGSAFAEQTSAGVYLVDNATSWTSASDERLKTDLKPILNAAEKVSSLRAVTGRFKTDDEGVSRAFLIAQDVLAVLPEAVDSSNPDVLGVSYADTIPLLVAAIKELSAELNELKQKVNA